MKETLGFAIAENAEKSHLHLLLPLISNANLGRIRDAIALKIATWKDPRVVPALVAFLSTGEGVWSAITALRRARAWSQSDLVEPYLTSTNSASREAARKFMKAMGAAKGGPPRR